ncbi:cysteine synthase A [Campylobacter sp. RM9344]|uniref:Cysteine synthase n=1 Tax=Campylobacter californiensis TaxID=1032243 RepID=A0AAW3ZSC3_9BACT|nr:MULTISPECIES: cysteine synthase A [unclassified Campylobacter]MBE2983932.1 cysteine synthase A [Campylobacter sp. RM6883]MBE2994470.1 cysteine synthase A [Campylobacter sp. RM6913]MBE3028778.1 cysteine synthase A [Campylobacter sp. RM9344]MBE3607667.1 cysteine synthase A [Campylobacter sp. RM9337]QCD51059.1 cysteine synthase [Campylobacter sp. RM6914]
MIYENITQTIGKTPVVKLKSGENEAEIYAKLEFFNPGSSVKDRIAFNMIQKMLQNGKLKDGDTIVEPTSGNTGIGVAMVGSALGFKVVLCMPESMSIERRKIVAAYGAKLELTEAAKGMKGAIARATELAAQPNHVILSQFENEFNPEAHELNTGVEIIADFDSLDAFVAGVGTGGTISGVAKKLKEKGYNTKIVAVEPEASPVLSGGNPSPHKIQGIGAGFVPDTMNLDIVDEIQKISNEDAMLGAREVAKSEGILFGISGGAAYVAARRVAKALGKGKKVLFIAPDNGERYLSTELYGV